MSGTHSANQGFPSIYKKWFSILLIMTLVTRTCAQSAPCGCAPEREQHTRTLKFVRHQSAIPEV